MSKAIEQHAIELKNKLSNQDLNTVLKECRKVKRDLESRYSVATTRTYLTIYRKALSSLYSEVTSILKLSKTKQNKIESTQNKKTAKAQKKLIRIKKVDAMIQHANKLLDSGNVAKITLGLCLLTGRRMTEILKTAKFINHKNRVHNLIFEGQLKTKGDKERYSIYTLGDRDKVKKALKELRALIDTSNMTNKEVERKYERTINSRCLLEFNKFLGRCTSHDLRKAYATICAKRFKKDSQAMNSFLSDILGHSENDITTANKYQKYYI